MGKATGRRKSVWRASPATTPRPHHLPTLVIGLARQWQFGLTPLTSATHHCWATTIVNLGLQLSSFMLSQQGPVPLIIFSVYHDGLLHYPWFCCRIAKALSTAASIHTECVPPLLTRKRCCRCKSHGIPPNRSARLDHVLIFFQILLHAKLAVLYHSMLPTLAVTGPQTRTWASSSQSMTPKQTSV